MLLQVLVLSVLCGLTLSEECPSCDGWAGGVGALCAYNAVTYPSKCDLFVALCANGVISSGGSVDINTIGVDAQVDDFIDYMGKCTGDESTGNCPDCIGVPSNPVCGTVGSDDMEFNNNCELVKELCESGVIAFDESTDFSTLDEAYYASREDVQDHTNWGGKCSGLCPVGQYSMYSNTEYPCQDCPGGQYSGTEGANGCTKCSVGSYQGDTGSSSCRACPANSTTLAVESTSVAQCVEQCKEGTVSTDGVTNCTDCAKGSYQASRGQNSCTLCPSGTTTLNTGSTDVSQCQAKCSAGEWSLDGYRDCQKCPVGTFQELEGQTSCRSCPPDTITRQEGSTSLTQCVGWCSAGTFSADRYRPCTACDGNTYADTTGSTLCKDCPVGVVNANHTKCLSCDRGSYFAGSGCALCPSGTYSVSTGALSCTDCDAGYYSQGAGNAECTECSEGTYAASSGAVQCELCPKDTYMDHTAATVCLVCSEGETESSGSVSAAQCGTHNWALIGNATQSGTTWNGTADKAVDGGTRMACLKGFCAHTEFMLEPWWYVDLGEDRSIVEIGVLVPNDTLSGVQGATVTVGNSTNGTDHVQCGVILIEELVYSKRHFVCADGTVGRIVRVQATLQQETYLSLCEVEVYTVPPRVPCPRGSVSETGYRPCTACPAGYITKQEGSTQCVPCQHGWTTYKNNIGECVGPKLYTCQHVWYNGQCKVYTGPTEDLGSLGSNISAVDVLEGDWFLYYGRHFTSHTKTVREGWNEDDLRKIQCHPHIRHPIGSMNDKLQSVRPDYSRTFCYQGTGASYRGKHQTTVTGRQCQKWSYQWPHRHHFNETRYFSSGLGEHAYCRNPDNSAAPWCYTNELDKRWDFCEIPKCASSCAPGHYVELLQCKQCPAGTYSRGGGAVDCTACPHGMISFAGSDSVDDCFTRRGCGWDSEWPCDRVSGCSYGCNGGYCWSQCNGACGISGGVWGVCSGCSEWCYLSSGNGYKTCSSNDDCTAVRRNKCLSACSL